MNFTAELMTKVGNIPKGKTPKYEDLVDLSFAKEAIKELGEYKGPSARRRTERAADEGRPAGAIGMSVANEVDAGGDAAGRAAAARPPSRKAAVLAAAGVLPLRLRHPDAGAVGTARAAGQPDPVLVSLARSRSRSTS